MKTIESLMSSPPAYRSKIRMFIGKVFFSLYRYLFWWKNRALFARVVQEAPLPFGVFSHSTPLLRQLRNVDMWLQHNKVHNLRLAAKRLNGVILKPGQTFSFWRLVGKPTGRKGYLKGMVLVNGSVVPEVGGGLCQLSNLIYWMTLHTPLTVGERWRHNYDVFPDSNRTQPFGSGATVAYNYIDLQVRNDTSDIYQLLAWVADGSLHGEWRCDRPVGKRYQVYECGQRITHEWWGGYLRHNVLRRRIVGPDGRQIDDELVAENHAVMMYEPLLPLR